MLNTNSPHDLIFPGKNARDWAEIHPAWNIVIRHRARRRVA
ncbi:MAG TPA: hypothetical protein VNF47_16025 [Streptosporangiaceae bacterium]|nr:hypothetical protein [Streptosporangiaceae bacterium]